MQGYDYSQPGTYFSTLCAHERECLFGEIVGDVMRLNACGEMVTACWQAIPQHFHFARLDTFVVMPNHFHAIVHIVGGAQCRGDAMPTNPIRVRPSGNASPLPTTPPATSNGTAPGSLAAIVQNFKSVTARKINQARQIPAAPVWQRNYYERVVRDEVELNRICQYILDNPLKWALDRENPAAAVKT
jgi:REP element-mobilizing transposase RayT